MVDELNDAELMRQAQGGHFDALEQLLSRYQKDLFGYLYRRLGQRQDAEDALKEPVSVWRKV